MELTFRKTARSEFEQTEHLTREAFWNMYMPGCNEHLVLHQQRESGCFIEDLDHVAIYEGEIVGHVISTKAKVIDKKDFEHEVLCVGPFSVLPLLQNNGIGTKLLNYSISEAGRLGYRGMILFGNPDYYHRFGFINAKEFEITTKDLQNYEPFMALELREHGLDQAKCRFFEDQAFEVNEEQLIEFEKKFPAKVKGKPKVDLSQVMH